MGVEMWSFVALPVVIPIGPIVVQAAELSGGCVGTETTIMLMLTTAGLVGGPAFAYGISRGKGKAEENARRISEMRKDVRHEFNRVEGEIDGLRRSAMRVYRTKDDG